MYNLEQIEKIWLTTKPLYFRLVEGEKSNGMHRHTDFFDIPKGEVITAEKRASESTALFDRFLLFLDMVNDGVYTLILQPSKSGSSAQAPFTFAKGDPSTFPQKVGSTASRVADGGGGGGNWGMSAQSPMLVMLQMMQQNNAQQLAMQQQSNAAQMAMMQQLFQKDMEINKLGQVKGGMDKLFALLEKPHVWGLLSKFAPAQTVAIGRAQAAVNETVEREPVTDETPQTVEAPAQAQVNRLKNLLEKVQKANPDADPIAVLDEGFDQVQAFLAMQNA
jgi:hypothetical protein